MENFQKTIFELEFPIWKVQNFHKLLLHNPDTDTKITSIQFFEF
jgi:hypothetical protein